MRVGNRLGLDLVGRPPGEQLVEKELNTVIFDTLAAAAISAIDMLS